ncbi:MAG: acetate kinase [Erysipelotrichales bacterium]|nr:acetate kinase [Erysipelotrichales bacterium]
MKILTVNAGSSSLKFNCIELPSQEELISGYFEKIGMDGSFYSIKMNGEKVKKQAELKDHTDAVSYLKQELLDNNIVVSLDEIDGVGHRLVHGGDKFKDSVLLTDEVIKECEKFNDLAPLHNPAMIKCIEAFKSALPETPMVGVFDTSFHQTIPEINYLYSVPYSWYKDFGIRKYGFHGTSHKYITKTMKELLGKDSINIINCHIGSGSSICCIKDSKSVDTTMGFSPNAGLIMGTRSGDIDYSVIPFYMSKTGKSITEVDNILNKESGLLGISEKYSDHRDIEDAMAEGDEKCILANDMCVKRVVDYITKYYVELEGNVDAIVFTAGLGENAREFRESIINKLNCLGIKIDAEVNMGIASYKDIHEGKISAADSKVPVYVIPTNEELMIALDTFEIINN